MLTRNCRVALLICALLQGFLPTSSQAEAKAELPIEGGLGIRFATPLSVDQFGAERDPPNDFPLPDNIKLTLPAPVPGAVRPWRWLLTPVIPHPFRSLDMKSFVMLGDKQQPIRIVAKIPYTGCDTDYAWLKGTLQKKNGTAAEPDITPSEGFDGALRITTTKHQIDVQCGPFLKIEYMATQALAAWTKAKSNLRSQYDRESRQLEKRRFVLESRRARAYADTFTLGDQYRLNGAFGIAFDQKFAPLSTQRFPIDRPFIVGLPNLPGEFSDGEIRLELAPDKSPILIRGKFPAVDFTKIAHALKSKYGTPMKSSPRHVIHKVSGKRAILKRLPGSLVELTFIDIQAQEDQRSRRWAKETEGL